MKSRLYRNKDWLYHKYWVEELSTKQVAKECQISPYIILNWMKRLNIKTRTFSEAGKICQRDRAFRERCVETWYKNNPRPWHDKNWLYEEYAVKQKSISQIAMEWKASGGNIGRWLRKHNIFIRSCHGRDVKGNKNPRWNDGVSEYPDHAFFKKQRILALKRAGEKCGICSKKTNVVHHIDGSNDNHELDNLMAVCYKCHWLLHGNNRTDYVHEYGMTPKKLATYFGVSPKVVRGWNRSFLGKQKLLSANL